MRVLTNLFHISGKKTVIVLFLVALALASFTRFYDLAGTSLRADSISFYFVCKQPISVYQIYSDWMRLLGESGQFPFEMAATKAWIDISGMGVNELSLSIPAAIWGVISVALFFFAARAYGGPITGLIAMFLLALSPFHIQMTREPYFYPPLLLGGVLGLWAAIATVDWAYGKLKAGVPFFVLHAFAFFFLTHTTPSGWNFAIVYGLLVGACVLIKWYHTKRLPAAVWFLGLIYLIIGLPLIIEPWGLHNLRLVQSHYESDLKIFTDRVSNLSMTLQTITSFGWGSTPFRLIFSYALVFIGIVTVLIKTRESLRWLVPIYLIIAGYCCYFLSHGTTATPNSVKFVAAFQPAYLLVITLGLSQLISKGNPLGFKQDFSSLRKFIGWTAIAAALIMNLYPAYLATQLSGLPTPYREIRDTAEKLLPPGTPVLVDRWFEPWNELSVYGSSRIIFTFTIPDEPRENRLQANWSKTALDFFARHPSAAYLEFNRGERDERQILSKVRFKRSIEFSNLAGLKLRELGLACRDDFYMPHYRRLLSTLYYNLPADIVDIAKESGQPLFVMTESGWTYLKPWLYTHQDFRDWNQMTNQAVFGAYNFTTNTTKTRLKIIAANPGQQNKTVCIGEDHHTFPPGILSSWTVELPAVRPGRNEILVRDPNVQTQNSPLWLDSVTIE